MARQQGALTMSEFFRAHQAVGLTVPTYFIESTAPNNVDDTIEVAPVLPPELKPIDSDLAVRQIAAALANAPEPNLVVMVHGFNNPEPAVLKMYTSAARAIEADGAIRSRQGLVCVGYRWPSEKMGQPIEGTWDAMPTLPTWILYAGAALLVLPFLLLHLFVGSLHCPIALSRWLEGFGAHVFSLAGLILAGLVLTAALLRTIVYFRDTYRATNYGAPDLVQIIRAIDGAIVDLRGPDGVKNDVQLSFIGHSMGGFVVTNTIRVLSDVFLRQVRALSEYGAHKPEPPSPNIGNVFCLKRFVLASPDIPAETLLSNRGNFLASALSRFDEAFLFSNEGDEVLRQISTLANYFVFPTKHRRHGFRLGNVEILSTKFGLIDISEEDFLRILRIGNLTLQQLYDALECAKAKRGVAAGPLPARDLLPKVFTYFDCTDYVDLAIDGGPRPLLTFAKWVKRTNPNAKLRWFSHLHLLFAYLFRHRPNVHAGYFEGLLSQQLMYRLACLGYRDTVTAYGGEGLLSQACEDKHIRALVSPWLAGRRPGRFPGPVAPALQPESPSSPAPTVTIELPNLIGMTIGQARLAVAALSARVRGPHLLLLEIAKQSQDQPPGMVLSQTPAPGSPVQPGMSIEAVVATR
jgi:PASTA domain